MASLRTGSLARHWAETGCDVKVVTREPLSESMPMQHHAGLELFRVRDPLGKAISFGATARSTQSPMRYGFRVLRWLKSRLIVPDQFFVWAFMTRNVDLPLGWVPDVVVGSGGPLSALLLAGRYARRFASPLVLDFRDPIASRRNYHAGRVRRILDFQLEKFVVRRADLIVSVSKGCAQEIGEAHGRTVGVVYNGFEPRNHLSLNADLIKRDCLDLVYTGTVYENYSDMRPLFSAIASMRISKPGVAIRLHHFGPDSSSETISRWASQEGVQDSVVSHGEVSHEEALTAQSQADALVLLLWSDVPAYRGVLSGKIFEYLHSGRPVIQIGGDTGEAAELVSQSSLNVVSSSAQVLSEQLDRLVQLKRTRGMLPSEAIPDLEAYSRSAQSAVFLNLIRRMDALSRSE